MVAAYTAPNVSSATLRALNYSPEVSKFLRRGELGKTSNLGDLAHLRNPGNGIFKAYSCAADLGVPFLTQSDIFQSEPAGRTIRTDNIPDIDSRTVQRGQILIAGVGTLGETELYGRSIIADKRLIGKLLSSDILLLEQKHDEDTHFYIYAFLCTKVGVRLVRSTSAGTKLLRPRKDLLRKLPIPVPEREKVEKIAELVRTTITEREIYLEEIQAARACIEELPEMQDAISMCAERKGRCTLWDGELSTITGWTYASTGGALAFLRKKWDQRLKDVIKPNGLFNGPRFVRTPVKPPHGFDFLSQRDLHMIRPAPARIAKPKVQDRLLFVPEKAILIASLGQFSEGALFGRAEIATSETAKAALTQHILRMYVHDELALQIYAFLSTQLGLRFLRSTAIGNSVPMMRLDLVKNLPIPTLNKDTGEAVNKHMEQALKSRVLALQSEQEAVRIIEEEVLPEWLA